MNNSFSINNVQVAKSFKANISFKEGSRLFSLFFKKEGAVEFDNAFKHALVESLKTAKTQEDHSNFARRAAKAAIPDHICLLSLGAGDSENFNIIENLFAEIENMAF